MRYASIPVANVRAATSRFDFYRHDPFGERTATIPESPVATQVIVREISGTKEYELIFGHLLLKKLPPEGMVPAAIYSMKELPDEECGRLILEYDRTAGSQLLTQYERASVIKTLGIVNRRAAEILGVSEMVVSKWLRGAATYEEIMAAGGTVEGLSFSHLITLAEVTGLSMLEITVEDKRTYLQKALEDDLSVKKFREFLEVELGLVEDGESTKRSKRRSKSSEEEGSFSYKGGTSSGAEELQLFVDNTIQEAGLDEYVKAVCTAADELEITIGPISTSKLGEVASCLQAIHAGLQSKKLAA